MFGSNASALLVLGVILIAVLSVVALWLWWSSGREDDEDFEDESPPGEAKPTAASFPGLDEPLQGSFIERLRESLKPLIPKRGTTLPTSSSPIPPGYAASASSQTLDTEAVEVVRVLRDLADGSLMVEVGGVRYRAMEQVVDQTVARRLMGNAQEFAQFVGMDTSGDIIAPPPSYTASPPPEPPRDRKESEAVVPALAPEEEPSEESVADAIDEVLQARLAASSEFSGRKIHIDDSPDGGVVIEVDGVRYQSVADITDVSVREFIQATIREWESEE